MPITTASMMPSCRKKRGRRVRERMSMGIRFVGICIPWSFAHVSTGRQDRKPWEDHLTFIENLRITKNKTILMGDFNQHIPKTYQPNDVYFALNKLIKGMTVLTSNMGLDHIAISNELKASKVLKIPTGSNSDHDGVSCSIF